MTSAKVWFVGAGPGAADLLTLRAARVIADADVVVWAASLVHPDVLAHARPDAEIVDSAALPLEGVRPLYERALAARPGGRAHPLGRPGAVGRGPGAAGAVRRARPRARDGARGQRLRGGSRHRRPGADRARGRPVRDPHPTRRRQDPDARRRGPERAGGARHHHGGLPVRRTVRPAPGRAAVRRLPAGHPGARGLPGDLAGRAGRRVHRRDPRRDRQGAQTVETHAVPRRPGARRQRQPLAPVPPRPLPRLPPGRPGGPPELRKARS